MFVWQLALYLLPITRGQIPQNYLDFDKSVIDHPLDALEKLIIR